MNVDCVATLIVSLLMHGNETLCSRTGMCFRNETLCCMTGMYFSIEVYYCLA